MCVCVWGGGGCTELNCKEIIDVSLQIDIKPRLTLEDNINC